MPWTLVRGKAGHFTGLSRWTRVGIIDAGTAAALVAVSETSPTLHVPEASKLPLS